MTPTQWKTVLDMSRTYKKDFGDWDNWALYRDYVRGKFFEGDVQDVLTYNITYAQLHTLVPNIYFRNPGVSLTPRYGGDQDVLLQTKMQEALDNWFFERVDMKAQMTEAIEDAFSCGTGFIRLGYGVEYGHSETKEREYKGKRKIDVNPLVGLDKIWAKRVDPDYIFVPFGTHRIDDASWMVQSFWKETEDVKARYGTEKRVPSTGQALYYRPIETSGFMTKWQAAYEMTELLEIRDARTGELATYLPTDNEGEFLRPFETDKLQIDGYPFVPLQFNNDPQYFWARSDVSLIQSQQLEVNDARTQAMMLRRGAVLRIAIQERAVSDDELDKILSGKPALYFKTKGVPSTVMHAFQTHIPVDLPAWTSAIRSDAREISGIGRNASGEYAEGRRSATEAKTVAVAGDVRLGERRSKVGDMLEKVVSKYHGLVHEFWDAQNIVEIVGIEGARHWVRLSDSAPKLSYRVKIDIESLSPMTKMAKKRELLEVIGVLSKNPNVNMDLLMRMLLREYDYADAMGILPQAQQQGPASMNEFKSQQQSLQGNPQQLQAARGQNLQAVRGGLTG